jgi:hypothetical protein
VAGKITDGADEDAVADEVSFFALQANNASTNTKRRMNLSG